MSKSLTYWVAFPKMIHGGSPSAIVDTLLHYGATGVAPRGGVGGGRDDAWSAAHTRACLDAGLAVHPWIFSHPHSIAEETELARRLVVDEGATGYIIDAELPWNHDSGRPYWSGRAIEYGEKLREALGGRPIWDAPWSHIAWHPSFPILAFDGFVDKHCPQYYWTEHGLSLDTCMLRCSAQWARSGCARPIDPIGVTYGDSDLRPLGAHCPASLVMGDVDRFLDRYGGQHLYTLEMAMRSGQPDVPPRPPTSPLVMPAWGASWSWAGVRSRLGI